MAGRLVVMRVGVAQIAPIVLDREATVRKVAEWVTQAAKEHCHLVAFGETLIPTYPFWIEATDGARFQAPLQQALFARYASQAVTIEAGHLGPIREAAAAGRIAVIVGVAEAPRERGKSIYCSRVFIDEFGKIGSVHRKLMPTHEERLTWAIGDGAGLVTHRVGDFTVGALNCWENWIPLARAALYAGGEDLHVALWPGSSSNTVEITRFIALESRSFVLSASGLYRPEDIPADFPKREAIIEDGAFARNGGSCVASPDGQWIIEPAANTEELMTCDINPEAVLEARHSFDPAGHYARPDVLRLIVNRRRHAPAEFVEDEPSGAPRRF